MVALSAEESRDGRVVQWIWARVRAGARAGEDWQPSRTGVPHGAGASPVWSHIFRTPLDRAMTAAGFRLTRWAEDFVVLGKTRDEAQRAFACAARFLREELGVTVHPQKTRSVHRSQGLEVLGDKVKQGKGFRVAAQKRRRRANPLNLYAGPREKSVKRVKDQIRQLTRRNAPVQWREGIERVNPVSRGWGTYYRKAHGRRLFQQLDRWSEPRLYSFRAKRGRNALGRRYPTARRSGEVGRGRLPHLVPGLGQR